jgi:hypothetical protein
VAGITRYIHILVAEAFIPNPENKPTVNHLNGVDGGDAVENLEWATWEEQQEHAFKTGLASPGKTPAIVLDTNGYIMSEHETTREALTNYNGRNVYYNKDVQIVGNAIIMKRSYYDSLEKYELDKICKNSLKLILERSYIVDNQLIDSAKQAGEMTDTSYQNVIERTKNRKSATINNIKFQKCQIELGYLMTMKFLKEKFNMSNFTLTKPEMKILMSLPFKQTEIYIMKKFIQQYKFFSDGSSSKTDCWRKLNEFLVSEGYKPKKHVSSVTKLWDEPFVSYEFDKDYYGGM